MANVDLTLADTSLINYSEAEIYDAAGNNDVDRMRELLDSGFDINMTDFDKGWTPLHVAAARGGKQCLELLVQRGAIINCQDYRGSTPLHPLIYKRFDTLALWFVKQGADLSIPDQRGFSPRDNALDWFQKELDSAAELVGKEEEEKIEVVAPVVLPPKKENTNIPAEEVMKVYLRNNSYKSIKVLRDDTAAELVKKMASKLNMSEHEKHFEVIEHIKNEDRHLHAGDSILKSKFKWPMIFGPTGNETNLHCHFIVALKRGAPPEVHAQFEQAFV